MPNKKDKKKFEPFIREPNDTVDTIYCSEDSDEYKSIIENHDMLPYQSPMPRYRREPEPPII